MMSSEESSSWMTLGLIPSSIGVTTASVTECCNGLIAWWTGRSARAADDGENLVEPLVENEIQIMDDRLNVEEPDLVLDQADENQESNYNITIDATDTNTNAYIENPLLRVTSDSKHSIHSQLEDCIDDDDDDDDDNDDNNSQSHLSNKRETLPKRLDIENALAALDEEEDSESLCHSQSDIVPISKDECKNKCVGDPMSIFRSNSFASSKEQVVQTVADEDETKSKDEPSLEFQKPGIGKSKVKKRVSDLVGIFESLSMDEDENITPTSLCSSSSFAGPKSAQDCCRCCNKKIYLTDATITYHDKLFHGGCFKCHLCDRKFSKGLSEVAGLVTKEVDSTTCCVLTCTKCRDDAAVKHLPLRRSTPACQPITITTPEKGNIQQVKDEIGDDLESVMDGMVPRCAICGIHFLGGGESSDMMILGLNKYHRKCRMYGRPMVERCERKVLPIVAANYVPESLVVRLCNKMSVEESCTKEVMTTLYFILPDKATDLQRIRGAERPNENVNFEFIMDSSAYANPNYEGPKKNAKTTFPCHGVGNPDSQLSVSLLGDPFGLPVQMAHTRVIQNGEGALLFCAELKCSKFQLRHRLDLIIHKRGELVDLKTATLSLNIAE